MKRRLDARPCSDVIFDVIPGFFLHVLLCWREIPGTIFPPYRLLAATMVVVIMSRKKSAVSLSRPRTRSTLAGSAVQRARRPFSVSPNELAIILAFRATYGGYSAAIYMSVCSKLHVCRQRMSPTTRPNYGAQVVDRHGIVLKIMYGNGSTRQKRCGPYRTDSQLWFSNSCLQAREMLKRKSSKKKQRERLQKRGLQD